MASPGVALQGPLTVRFFLATERGNFHLAPGREVVIRRSDSLDEIVLTDPAVSRQPGGIARLKLGENGLVLEPTPGQTSVLVNGLKVVQPRRLDAGDRVRIGYSVFVVQGLEERGKDDDPEIRTIKLDTAYVHRREELSAEADRLAQWAEGFDALRAAGDDAEAAAVILEQVTRMVQSDRALVALGGAGGEACRELAACGLHGGEVEELLRLLNETSFPAPVLMPLVQEVLDSDRPGRAVLGRVEVDEQPWYFYVEPAGRAPIQALSHRAMSVFSSLLQLYHLFRAGKGQRRLLDDLSETVRIYARPPEEENFRLVQQRFVFAGPSLRAVCRSLARAAASSSPVLLLGEPGTGKQLAAEAIHAASPRRHREMVSVNLTEYPETLVESMLFGHARGAFTGASSAQVGLIALANHSTLFLDEIGEIPLPIQAKLLRVLERGEFRRLGDHHLTKVDIRIVTATNRDLHAEVRAGRFRQDLFDRINVIPIVLPPLRDRLDDIPPLVEYFLRTFNAREGKEVRISEDGVRHLRRYTWPDNVRGLRNYVERAVSLADAGPVVLGPDELPPFTPPTTAAPAAAPSVIEEMVGALRQRNRHNQARMLKLLYESSERLTKGELAERLGISRPVCRSELQKLIAYALANGLGIEFFERRLSLRAEDWAKINALGE